MSEKTVMQWTRDLATKEGEYGGGSAASLVGALAASLAQFVFELQKDKKKYQNEQKLIHRSIDQAQMYNQELLELADVDAHAFEPVIPLFKLPKNTEEEKQLRQEKLDKALVEATLPPLDIIKKVGEVTELFSILFELNVTGSIMDDIIVGLLFSEAAIIAGRLNCMSNIKMIKEKDLKNELEKEVEEVYTKNLNNVRELKKKVDSFYD